MLRTNDLTVTSTAIPGLLLLTLPVHGDNRGWFKENWQREKMTGLGLPDFRPVQNNVAFNRKAGTTRGFHAEPWDKYISVIVGSIFGAWVDLRRGDTFGMVVTAELDPSSAVFVPRGVANSFQTLVANTAYSYLVNDHWNAASAYASLNLADETAAVEWPVGLDRAELSEKDRTHPRLDQIMPIEPRRTLILGADGQLGRALRRILPNAEAAAHTDFDLLDPAVFASTDWRVYDTIINAAAYTKVDEAETLKGRRMAWKVNVHAVAELAKVASRYDITLVQVSSDYVFDGEREVHTSDETFSPLGVYGQTKAAGDAIVSTVPKHYIVRTSWVVGEGTNFIRTMERLAYEGIEPKVVNDQFGRLTYAEELAEGIAELLASGVGYGTYNITGSGPIQSWFDIARDVFSRVGKSPECVSGIPSSEYAANHRVAPRPRSSVLEGRPPDGSEASAESLRVRPVRPA